MGKTMKIRAILNKEANKLKIPRKSKTRLSRILQITTKARSHSISNPRAAVSFSREVAWLTEAKETISIHKKMEAISRNTIAKPNKIENAVINQ